MTTFRFSQTTRLLALGLLFLFASCKEINPEFPPHTWSEYAYTSTSIAPRIISAIFYENEHSVWLGANGAEGLLYNDGYSWSRFNKENTGINFDSITSIVRDGNEKLWIGWKTGLATYDGNIWQEINSFKGLCVTSLAVEGIGNIKAGIKGESGGIAEFQNNKWEYYSLNNSDIPSENINAVTSDHDQVLWMATEDKGIVRFKNNTWKTMSNEITLLSQEFTCVTTAPDGSIWAGSAASQIIHFYDDTFSVLNTGTSKPITAIVATEDGSIWCSTYGAGLVKFDDAGWKTVTMENEALPSNDIYTMAKGYPGYLFFSIPDGKVLIINQ